MTDIVKRGEQLPADYISRLMSGIAESRAQTIVAGGKPFFRMSRSGTYIFGQSNEEMQEGSRWAVNIMTMSHGWSCWVDGGPNQANVLAGEVMTAMTNPLPPRPDPIGDSSYKDVRSFEMKCLDGADAGTEVIYKINSVGGIRAVAELLDAIHAQLAWASNYPCPVLTFSSDSYPHKKWGTIYVPIFTVVGWADMNGNLQGDDQPSLPLADRVPTAEPVRPAPEPARKRKAPLGTAPAAPAEPVAPAPTAQTHIGQRRRPSAA